jgi:tripartite-type tricarboxylate transporter receptor subunit TctC
MAMSLRRFGLAAVLLAPLTVAAQQPAATDYPSKPIRVVVGAVAGGPFDFITRTLGRSLQNSMSFVLDNRGGAGGAVATDIVVKSPADGYTMLVTSSSHASLPVTTRNLSFDAVKDLAPITMIATSVGFLFVVHPSNPARNVQQFITGARAQPGKLSFGSAGVGNVMHFAAEMFNSMADTRTNHVPYKGVAQVLPDLVAGRIDFTFGPPTTILPFVKAEKLRALGITAMTRWAELPEVPTINEQGVKGYVYLPWYGYWFPAGTPRPIVNRMRNEMARALEDPEVRKAFAEQGFVPVGSTPDEFAKTIVNEIELNRGLAARIGLKPE